MCQCVLSPAPFGHRLCPNVTCRAGWQENPGGSPRRTLNRGLQIWNDSGEKFKTSSHGWPQRRGAESCGPSPSQRLLGNSASSPSIAQVGPRQATAKSPRKRGTTSSVELGRLRWDSHELPDPAPTQLGAWSPGGRFVTKILLVSVAANGSHRLDRMNRGRVVGAVDQGTTSTRFMIFDHSGTVIASAQREFRQILPQPGWVEHDPAEILQTTEAVVQEALRSADMTAGDLAAVGIANQRETTVVWDRTTGRPLANAIVWQDTRTDQICDRLARDGGIDRFRDRTGLPLATYFSGPKAAWLLENADGVAEKAARGQAVMGTVDSWLVWNLTCGVEGGRHVTDVTNASRTQLMDLDTLDWCDGLVGAMGIPPSMMAEILPSTGRVATGTGVLRGVPISAILGDQQAALFGQTCFRPGEAKNTYGDRVLSADEHRKSEGAICPRPAHHGRIPDRRIRSGVRLGGIGGRDRFSDPMAPRQPRFDLDGARGGGVGCLGARQRRRLLRAGLLGTVRPPLEDGRPRSDHRPHPVRHPGSHRPSRPGSHRLPDPGGPRRDAGRLRSGAHRVAGGRGNGRQQPAHAVPVGHPRCGGGLPPRERDHRPGRRLRRRTRRGILGRTPTICAGTGRKPAAGRRRCRKKPGKPGTPAGRRP